MIRLALIPRPSPSVTLSCQTKKPPFVPRATWGNTWSPGSDPAMGYSPPCGAYVFCAKIAGAIPANRIPKTNVFHARNADGIRLNNSLIRPVSLCPRFPADIPFDQRLSAADISRQPLAFTLASPGAPLTNASLRGPGHTTDAATHRGDARTFSRRLYLRAGSTRVT